MKFQNLSPFEQIRAVYYFLPVIPGHMLECHVNSYVPQHVQVEVNETLDEVICHRQDDIPAEMVLTW